MNRPSPELVACMLQAHEEFARRFTSVDSLAELADAGPDDIRRAATIDVISARHWRLACQARWIACGPALESRSYVYCLTLVTKRVIFS
jgi:hypothetical protein